MFTKKKKERKKGASSNYARSISISELDELNCAFFHKRAVI